MIDTTPGKRKQEFPRRGGHRRRAAAVVARCRRRIKGRRARCSRPCGTVSWRAARPRDCCSRTSRAWPRPWCWPPAPRWATRVRPPPTTSTPAGCTGRTPPRRPPPGRCRGWPTACTTPPSPTVSSRWTRVLWTENKKPVSRCCVRSG